MAMFTSYVTNCQMVTHTDIVEILHHKKNMACLHRRFQLVIWVSLAHPQYAIVPILNIIEHQYNHIK